MTTEELTKQVQDLANKVSTLEKKAELSYRQMLRLTNALQGSRVYFVSSSSGGSVTTQLTFKDGILTLVESPSISPSFSPSLSPSLSPSKSPSISPSVSPS